MSRDETIEQAARVLSTHETFTGKPHPRDHHRRQARALADAGLLARPLPTGGGPMTDTQAWLDQVSARLEAVKREPAQEEREYEAESQAWSDLYQHAPTDLTNALAAIQEVLDMHKRIPSRQWRRTSPGSEGPQPKPSDICEYCRGNYPCPTVRAISDAVGDPPKNATEAPTRGKKE